MSQGLLDRAWSHETVFKGATLGLEEPQDEAKVGAAAMLEALAREGLEPHNDFVVELGSDGMIFVCAQTHFPKE